MFVQWKSAGSKTALKRFLFSLHGHNNSFLSELSSFVFHTRKSYRLRMIWVRVKDDRLFILGELRLTYFLFLYANKQTNKAAWNCYSSYYTSLQLDYTSNYSEVQIRFKLGSKCLKSAWKTLIIWICSYLSHKVVYPNRRLSCLPQPFVLEQKGAACAKEHLLLLHVVEYPCRLFKYRLREREREKKNINLDFGHWSAKTLLICFCIEQIHQYNSVQCTITLLPAGVIIYLQVFQHSFTAVQLSTSYLTRLCGQWPRGPSELLIQMLIIIN